MGEPMSVMQYELTLATPPAALVSAVNAGLVKPLWLAPAWYARQRPVRDGLGTESGGAVFVALVVEPAGLLDAVGRVRPGFVLLGAAGAWFERLS
ncbi:MAG: hypothetical protein ACRDPG_05595 [Nocardioidaceae bacterium]